ncbi:MAG: hypothetical protein A2015_02225 [Spirochaetes bacterium GWF1_31_7]|nr:MAG: hypothetical protein A2Y30_06075 [Spirochaetes bacterium GWE1_32_154]OHD50732.1 MAG: hypothetical protein A2015_02225 [Spirochaetes bacterium GWF1_31_7]OHD81474.1 MAG: hypothetical protein A2355_11290 [Spirochaetes bacterium RIFOXYB1_FULL_32_8]HBD95069.1 hypothetical protein [Spirochaetia bacterium]HBI38045.1 hypothetical protein [Spirochaetia bacterium]
MNMVKKISELVARIFHKKQVSKNINIKNRKFYIKSQEEINAEIARELLFIQREYSLINRRVK